MEFGITYHPIYISCFSRIRRTNNHVCQPLFCCIFTPLNGVWLSILGERKIKASNCTTLVEDSYLVLFLSPWISGEVSATPPACSPSPLKQRSVLLLFYLNIQSIVTTLFVNTQIQQRYLILSNGLLGHTSFTSNSMNLPTMDEYTTNCVSVASSALIFVIDYLPQHSAR